MVYADTAALGPALSHDGRRIAVYRFRNGNMDIWSYETSRRAWDRITFGPGDDIYPLWSPDGTSIVSGSVRTTNVVDLYRTSLGAPQASEELLLATPRSEVSNWTGRRTGDSCSMTTLDPEAGLRHLGAAAGRRAAKPFAVVQTDFNEGLGAVFSGRQVDRVSIRQDGSLLRSTSGRFRGPAPTSRVSIDGGAQVRWNPNGKELFYLARR